MVTNKTGFCLILGVFLSMLALSCGNDFLFEEPPKTIEREIPAPGGLTATDNTMMARIRLAWNQTAVAESYNVYKSDLPEDGAFTLVATNIRLNTWDDTNVAAGYHFYYKIAYLTLDNELSEFSTIAKGMARPWQAPAPEALTVSESELPGRLDLSFSASSNTTALDWLIYLSTSEDQPYNLLGTSDELSYQTPELAPGWTYYFRVVGRDATGKASQLSEVVSFTIPPAVGLEAPESLSASQGSSQGGIDLIWTAVPGASGYRVYRHRESEGGYDLFAQVGGTSWTDSSTAPNQHFFYRVSATNDSAESLASPVAEGWKRYGDFKGATILTASDGTSSEGIQLGWLPVPTATSYQVWRGGAATGPFSLLANSILATNWFDQGVAPETRYWYQIRASRDDQAIGPPSPAEVGFRSHEDAPGVPTDVVGVYNRVWYHEVNWTAVSGAKKYRVYRADHHAGPYELLVEQTGTKYEKFHMADYADYYYRVSALNQAGQEGGWSEPVQSAPNTGVCAPDNLQAGYLAERDQVTLRWNPAKGATKVILERAPSPEGPWTKLGDNHDTDSTGYIDPIKTGTWFYRIKAENVIYTAGWSRTVVGAPLPYPELAPPSGLTGVNQAGGSEFALSWDEVSQAGGYQVYRARQETGFYSQATGKLGGTSWTATGIQPGELWFYRIATLNQDDQAGDLSGPVNNQTGLVAPRTLLASDGTGINLVSILWTPVAGAEAYQVYRSSDKTGVYLAIGDPVSTANFEDESPLPGTGWYRVAAIDDGGNIGPCSPPDSGYPKEVPIPSPPRGLTASAGLSTDKISLFWDPAPDAVSYRVARATKENGDYVLVSAPLMACEYFDLNPPAKEFFYKVAACNEVGLMGRLSESARGYISLTDRDFLLAYDTTIASSHTKLTLMHKDGLGALGKETAYGKRSGQLLYEAKTAGLGAKITFSYIDYCDDYLVLNGEYTITAKMDRSGTMGGTITVSSPIYGGTIRYDLIVKDGNASSGKWYVRQTGSSSETEIEWFPSPSSLL